MIFFLKSSNEVFLTGGSNNHLKPMISVILNINQCLEINKCQIVRICCLSAQRDESLENSRIMDEIQTNIESSQSIIYQCLAALVGKNK